MGAGNPEGEAVESDEDVDPPIEDDHGDNDAGDAGAEVDPEEAFENAERRRTMYDAARKIAAGKSATYSVALAALLNPRAQAVFDGNGITSTGGDPGVVGRLMVALDRYFDAMGVWAVLINVQFGNSVSLELQAQLSATEREQLEELAAAVADAPVQHEQEELPPDERLARQVERLAPAVPGAVVRLETATRILNEPPQRVAHRVRLAGVRPKDELRKLSDALAEVDANLRVTSNVATDARLTTQRAVSIARRLRAPETLRPLEITVVGRLTRTDSDAEVFRVVLEEGRIPPELGRRRRVIEGGYTDDASAQVREEGLWDRRVVAEVQAERIVPAGGGNPRLADFRFLSIRLAA